MSQPEDFATYLPAEARSGTAAFHEFRLLHSETGEELHAFYEGEEDPLFYAPYIRAKASGRALHAYVCSGKWEVEKVRAYIYDAGYTGLRCMFFVDRDYDELFPSNQMPTDEATFMTEYYSVENYLVCDHAVDVIVCDFAGFCAADPEHPSTLAAVRACRQNFAKEIKLLIAWALALREEGIKPNFNNVDLKNVFSVSPEGKLTRKQGGFARFKKVCGGQAQAPSFGAVRKWLAQLNELPEKEWTRGKFELWAFEASLIAALEPAVSAAKARGKRRVRVPSALRQRRLFDLLGGRLPPPATLSAFLEKRLTLAA